MSYGLIFHCDPLSFLDRDEADYDMLLALVTVAERRLREREKGGDGG